MHVKLWPLFQQQKPYLIAVASLALGMPNDARAKEGQHRWFMGGRTPQAEQSPPVADELPQAIVDRQASEVGSDTGEGWPNLSLPQIQWIPLWSRPDDPQSGLLNRPVNGLRAAGRNTVQATRSAWNTTVDKFKWGGTAAREEQFAQRQEQLRQQQAAAEEPGLFDRLFGTEPEEPQGPQTVVEWIAQERPGMGNK